MVKRLWVEDFWRMLDYIAVFAHEPGFFWPHETRALFPVKFKPVRLGPGQQRGGHVLTPS